MSGTYIKFFETPEHCGRCPFLEASYAADCFVSEEPIVCRYDRQPDDCPLVAVPDHGDLIDRDALDADLEKQDMKTGEWDAIGFSIHEIDNAPTIIGAD